MKSTDKLLKQMLQLAGEAEMQSEATELLETVPDGFMTRLEARLAWPAFVADEDDSDQAAYATSTTYPEPTSVAT